jgi:nitrous oxidase accessory protein NosD
MDKNRNKKQKSEDKKMNTRKGILLAVFGILVFCAFVSTVSADTIYVSEGGDQTIQQAVNNAIQGDTIIVRDGTYTKNVNVNVAHLTIRSENGSASTTVPAANSNDHVFYVTVVDYVNISGFTVTGATGSSKAGIYLGTGVAHCNISDNNASNNYYGIYLTNHQLFQSQKPRTKFISGFNLGILE